MKKLDVSSKARPNTFALVDDDGYNELNKSKWYICVHNYVERREQVNGDERFLHRHITKCPKGMEVDHENHNKLDNRRANLRVCTPTQNKMNRGPAASNPTKLKGVSISGDRCGRAKPWRARISINKKMVMLGRYAEPFLAAWAYNCAARVLYGEFAYLNEIPDCACMTRIGPESQ